MGETTLERYTIISIDGHAGADLLDYKPYLASRWHDEFDAWAAAYENPFADLLAADRVPQLGQRPPPRGDSTPTASSPRCCTPTPSRRSSSRATSSPCRRPSRTTTAAGPGSRPTTAGWSTSARQAPGRRGGICQIFLNHIDDAVAELRGRTTHMDVCGGVLLPSVSPNIGAARAVGPVLRTALGAVRGARSADQRAQRQRHPRLRRPRAGPGDHAHRAAVVRAPAALAPHLRRRVRPAPDPAHERSPSRASRGSRAASTPSTGSTSA